MVTFLCACPATLRPLVTGAATRTAYNWIDYDNELVRWHCWGCARWMYNSTFPSIHQREAPLGKLSTVIWQCELWALIKASTFANKSWTFAFSITSHGFGCRSQWNNFACVHLVNTSGQPIRMVPWNGKVFGSLSSRKENRHHIFQRLAERWNMLPECSIRLNDGMVSARRNSEH